MARIRSDSDIRTRIAVAKGLEAPKAVSRNERKLALGQRSFRIRGSQHVPDVLSYAPLMSCPWPVALKLFNEMRLELLGRLYLEVP